MLNLDTHKGLRGVEIKVRRSGGKHSPKAIQACTLQVASSSPFA